MPVLKNYPIQYIHEPWMASEQVQRAAKCVVGIDYPKPMIDHEMAAKQNQERMRQVYQQLSTYRNIKTPEDPNVDTKSPITLSSNGPGIGGSVGGTLITSNKYPNATLTLQQQKEQQQLMPAPLPVIGGNVPPGGPNPVGVQQRPQSRNTPDYSSVVDDDASLEVDALTPSINNYQPNVVSETLQRDASLLKDTPMMLENVRTSDLDVYQNQFLEMTTPSPSATAGTSKK